MTGLELLADETSGRDARAAWLRAGDARSVVDHLARIKGCHGKGRFGAVATGSPHATRVGMDILKAGGTAADAAAGAAFAMMVADPPNASLAGRGHILWAEAQGPAKAVDGATQAPSIIPTHVTRLPDAQALPLPGIVRAVLRLHSQAGRMSLADIASPARNLAREGFVVPPELARIWDWRAPELKDADARRVYLPEGKPVASGEVFRNPGIAKFFDHLIATRADPFSDPDFAAPFCSRLADKGAFWTPHDLISAEPLNGETVTMDGDGWHLCSIGRQGWGHTLLRIVGLVASSGATDVLQGEIAQLLAILRAFEERPEELRSLKPKTDPLPWDVLCARLGDPMPKDWIAPQFLSDAVNRAHAVGDGEDKDTTHLSVIDASGMRVALTQSIGPHFGARVADPETGILLAHSYRMAEGPTPGARDVTEQCPAFLDVADARYALGGAGSERIPGAVAAVIRHVLAGQDLPTALSQPRSNWVGRTARLHIDAPNGLEAHLDGADVETEFTGRGPVDHLGIVQAVGQAADGTVSAAADPAYAGSAAAE